ncbi:MAG TPA: hypothetical protein VK973_02045 [Arenicellales bacterium]|nr:hypothetical protein [Arenicellales bacterium]
MATDTMQVDCCIDENNNVSCTLSVDAAITVNGTFNGTSFTINGIDASSLFADCNTAVLNITGTAVNNNTQLNIVVSGTGDCDYPGSGPSLYSGNISASFSIPLVAGSGAC